jgi:hypothetical protein
LNYVSRHSDATAAHTATATGLGRSTVTRAFNALERTSQLRRSAADPARGKRIPYRWNLANRLTTLTGAPQLGRGQLRRLVLDHLATHAGQSVTGYQVGKAIGRSAGAIAAALVMLCDQRVIDRVSQQPLRYRYHRTTWPIARPRPQQLANAAIPDRVGPDRHELGVARGRVP